LSKNNRQALVFEKPFVPKAFGRLCGPVQQT